MAMPSDRTAALRSICPRKAGYEVFVSPRELATASNSGDETDDHDGRGGDRQQESQRQIAASQLHDEHHDAAIIRTMLRIMSTEPAAAFFERILAIRVPPRRALSAAASSP
jgi:hypothetical protein